MPDDEISRWEKGLEIAEAQLVAERRKNKRLREELRDALRWQNVAEENLSLLQERNDEISLLKRKLGNREGTTPGKSAIVLTDTELFLLSEFFNKDSFSMDNTVYDRIGRKLLVAAAKAGLYDEADDWE